MSDQVEALVVREAPAEPMVVVLSSLDDTDPTPADDPTPAGDAEEPRPVLSLAPDAPDPKPAPDPTVVTLAKPGPMSSTATATEQVTIDLTRADSSGAELTRTDPSGDDSVDASPAPHLTAASLTSEGQASDDPVSNPYAALAPSDVLATDVTPSARNPYAELAPNFETPPSDTEPGDWESMLDEWPQPPVEQTQPKKKPSAFSRHT